MQNIQLSKLKERAKTQNIFKWLLFNLSQDHEEPDRTVSFREIRNSIGIQDAVWILEALPATNTNAFMADVAESVKEIFFKYNSVDYRVVDAIDATRRNEFDNISLEWYDLMACMANIKDQAASYAAKAADSTLGCFSVCANSVSACCAASMSDKEHSALDDQYQVIDKLFYKHFIED